MCESELGACTPSKQIDDICGKWESHGTLPPNIGFWPTPTYLFYVDILIDDLD